MIESENYITITYAITGDIITKVGKNKKVIELEDFIKNFNFECILSDNTILSYQDEIIQDIKIIKLPNIFIIVRSYNQWYIINCSNNSVNESEWETKKYSQIFNYNNNNIILHKGNKMYIYDKETLELNNTYTFCDHQYINNIIYTDTNLCLLESANVTFSIYKINHENKSYDIKCEISLTDNIYDAHDMYTVSDSFLVNISNNGNYVAYYYVKIIDYNYIPTLCIINTPLEHKLSKDLEIIIEINYIECSNLLFSPDSSMILITTFNSYFIYDIKSKTKILDNKKTLQESKYLSFIKWLNDKYLLYLFSNKINRIDIYTGHIITIELNIPPNIRIEKCIYYLNNKFLLLSDACHIYIFYIGFLYNNNIDSSIILESYREFSFDESSYNIFDCIL
jgi:hypothetical protein